MGSRYLTDMDDVLRRVGVNVTEVNGWQTRARGSGGYVGNPQAIMVHHTAGRAGASSSSEVQYMTYGSPDAPLANLYIGRAGDVWVMAAGATNTNGKGGPLGPVPKDSMNSRAIGIEIGNNGVGEPYSQAQQNATIKTVQALSQAYGVPASQVYAHFEWAPTRKIDPSGPSRWSNNQNVKWDMNRFRNDVGAGSPPFQGAVVTTTKSEWQQARVSDKIFGPGDTLIQVPQAKGKKAVTVTLAVVTPNHDGYIVAFLGPQPPTASVNYTKSQITSNTVTVPVDANGWFAVHSTGYIRLITDLVGVHS